MKQSGTRLSVGAIVKEAPYVLSGPKDERCLIVPYLFVDADDEKMFICNLVTNPGNDTDIRKARKGMASILLSLRRHHFHYFSAYERYDDLKSFLDETIGKGYSLLANGRFFQYPMNRESVSFSGMVKETNEPFFFRIYDRELFLYLIHRLKGIKRETSHS